MSDKSELDVHIERYGELRRRQEVLRELQGRSCCSDMARHLMCIEPEKLGHDTISRLMYGAVASYRGDIHSEVEVELRAISRLLYVSMRDEVDRLVAIRRREI